MTKNFAASFWVFRLDTIAGLQDFKNYHSIYYTLYSKIQLSWIGGYITNIAYSI